jgi:hypothetical protein
LESADWTLLPPEAALLANKTGPTRLGFAVLLKFFQYAARFPLENVRNEPRSSTAPVAWRLQACAPQFDLHPKTVLFIGGFGEVWLGRDKRLNRVHRGSTSRGMHPLRISNPNNPRRFATKP